MRSDEQGALTETEETLLSLTGAYEEQLLICDPVTSINSLVHQVQRGWNGYFVTGAFLGRRDADSHLPRKSHATDTDTIGPRPG